ncbi:acyl-CoA carboxylase epsilon subunit [Actinacidiphila alni]
MEIKVERGTPTAEELAAVVALVQARAAAAGSAADDGPAPLDSWADPARNVPPPVPAPGPGAWRASAWPA